MAFQKHLESIDKKQAVIADQIDRIETKLDFLMEIETESAPAPMPAPTIAELETIDGVGPATAQKILDMIEAKAAGE